jgi:pyruvate,water dikinase
MDQRQPRLVEQLPFLRQVARVAFRYRVPPRIVEALVRPQSALNRANRIEEQLGDRLKLLGNATTLERIEFVERLLAEEVLPLFPTLLPAAAAGFGMLGIAGKLLGGAAQPGDLETVLRGLGPGTDSTLL